MTTKYKCQFYFIAVVIITLTTVAIYWSAARNEIFYLCGNFSSGVEKSSVIKQLKTANLSSYKQKMTKDGSKIIFSSKLNVVSYQCIIELDEDNAVVSAVFT